jgi:hypothetical protein
MLHGGRTLDRTFGQSKVGRSDEGSELRNQWEEGGRQESVLSRLVIGKSSDDTSGMG